MQQHLRALKAMGQEPSGSFITSMLELKLDTNTMFEHSQASTDVPHYKELLALLNLRAQASESSSAEPPKKAWKNEVRTNRKSLPPGKPIASFAATADSHCILCKVDRHPL